MLLINIGIFLTRIIQIWKTNSHLEVHLVNDTNIKCVINGTPDDHYTTRPDDIYPIKTNADVVE